jgi:hypothetical protein
MFWPRPAVNALSRAAELHFVPPEAASLRSLEAAALISESGKSEVRNWIWYIDKPVKHCGR